MRRISLIGLIGSAFLCTGCVVTSGYEPVTDREGIKRVIFENRRAIEACFLKAIDERPGAEGKVVMTWDIEPDGAVSDASIKEAGPKISHIGPCLGGEIRTWRFPKLSKEEVQVTVSYPFFFSENGKLEVR